MENLNTKVWYRTIKVLFILLFLSIQMFGLFITSAFISDKDFIIKCDDGRKFKSPYGKLVFDNEFFEAQKICTGSSFIPSVEIGETISPEQFEKIHQLDSGQGLLSFTTFEKSKYTLLGKTGFYTASFLAISFLFWLISRLFFYIVSGEKVFKIKFRK